MGAVVGGHLDVALLTAPDQHQPGGPVSLHRFDKDTADPSKSTCNDACAVKWPPVTIEEGGNVYLAGVNPKEVGAIRRDDGQVQITVGGWPVYRFSGDSTPGDLNGQGVGGTWFAVGPTGNKATS
jgi:predicted lipoprotein with Yx(FWY)xxD motif